MEFKVSTGQREEIVDITDKVEKAVGNLDKQGSACLVFVPHATAGIIVNENADPSVCEDIVDYLGEEIPKGGWKHDRIDNNADSHIKSSIVGPGQVIPMERGSLRLGTWQAVALAEFDGPRERKVIVKIL